jgi:hypothetical protein
MATFLLIIIVLAILLFILIAMAHRQFHVVAKVNIKLAHEKCFTNFINPNHLTKWLKGYQTTDNQIDIFVEMNSKLEKVQVLSYKVTENKEVYLKLRCKYFEGESWYKFYFRNSTETLIVNINIWNTNSYLTSFLFYVGKSKLRQNLFKNIDAFRTLVEKPII